MTHSDLIIDGDNLREDFGVTLCQGSTANFLSLPQFKDIDSDDWAEQDFIDVDASAPVFKRKEFDLTIQGGVSSVAAFCGRSDYSYFPLTISNTPFDLQKCLTKGVTSLSTLRGVSRATIRFTSDDDPYTLLDQHATAALISQLPFSESCWFAGTTPENFGSIGVRVVKGTNDSFATPPAVKQPLTRDVSITPGMIYDSHDSVTVYGSKRLTIQCLLNAGSSYTDFWNRWLHFMSRCTTRGGIGIVYGGIEGKYLYNSMRVLEYVPSKPVPWLKFSVEFIRIAQ
jgi:hypothetical protein